MIIKILFYLLPFTLCGQTLYTTTFTDFFKTDTANVVVNYILVKEWHTANGTTLIDDLSGKNRDLTINGWSDIAQVQDSCTNASIMYSGGNRLKFNNAAHYFSRANAVGFPNGTSPNWSILLVGRINTLGVFHVSPQWGSNIAAQGPRIWFRNGTPALVNVSTGGSANDLQQTTTGFSAGDNFFVVGTANGTTESLFINATSVATPKTITNTPTTTGFKIGLDLDNANPFKGYYDQVVIFNTAISTSTQKYWAYMPTGWLAVGSDDPGVSRVNWGFYLGLTGADTVYADTLITTGAWSISIDDSAASEVAYKILTSSNKLTWSTLTIGTTGTSWGTKTYTGTGSGYIGIAITSGTAYFDNLTVTLQPATTTGKFKGASGFSDGFKGW